MLLVALALLLLPGLLVVRAPWTAVAPLSLAFWALGAWWPPFAGPGRSRVVVAVLAASLLLSLLRLVPKHELPPPPGFEPPPAPKRAARPGREPPPLASAPSLVVLAAALLLLVPLPLWHHAPGARLAFQTTASRLVVWRDAIPASFEPLLPLGHVGAHAPALATLAADVSLLTGVDSGPAVLAVVALAAGLMLVGLFALHATWAPPWAAALGSLVAAAAAPWPGLLSLWGDGEALLALGFLLPAVALLLGHASRSSAVAAALLLAAGALAQPILAGVLFVLAAAAAAVGRRGPAAAPASRLATSGLVALALAGPGLLPLARAASAREALELATASRSHELLPFAFFLLLAALAPLGFVQASQRRTRPARAALAAVPMLAALLLVARVHGWIAAGQLSEPVRASLSRAAQLTTPLAVICAGEGVRDFVPALAGRRAGEPGVWIPWIHADEWARRERTACDVRLEALPSGR